MKKQSIAIIAVIAIVIFTFTGIASARSYYTKQGYPFSISRELLDKAMSMISHGDKAAFNKLVASGLVGITRSGVEVTLVDTHLFSGIVKIRPVGSTVEVYTLTEAIK